MIRSTYFYSFKMYLKGDTPQVFNFVQICTFTKKHGQATALFEHGRGTWISHHKKGFSSISINALLSKNKTLRECENCIERQIKKNSTPHKKQLKSMWLATEKKNILSFDFDEMTDLAVTSLS